MATDTVVVYFSRLAERMQEHERSALAAVASEIARLKNCRYGGCHETSRRLHNTFFVPDDTLLRDEAAFLDIAGPQDLFGGVVPHPFVKTKAITHDLVDCRAAQPEGWSSEFAARVRDVVLPGYTAFSARDARIAAQRLMQIGPVRVKPPLAAGGRAQRVLATAAEVDGFLDQFDAERLAEHGLVIEPELSELVTLSVGHITLNDMTMTYYGTQRSIIDNEGRSIYGGSDLLCVRGGWDALERLSIRDEIRAGIVQARTYDEAMAEYPGFFASRRNYDIAQGFDAAGQWRSGVLEASWRVGGASTAEVAALNEFRGEPALQVVEASSVKEFGSSREAPPGAVVHFRGEDPEAGPMIRYTIVTRRMRGQPLRTGRFSWEQRKGALHRVGGKT